MKPVELALTHQQKRIIATAMRELPDEFARAEFLKLMKQQLAPRTIDVVDAVQRAAFLINADVGTV